MPECSNCYVDKSSLVYLPMYGYLCPACFQDIIKDYLK